MGRLVARSVWPNERGYVNQVTVASMIPDLNVFISNSALDGLQTHRGITHLFMGLAVGACGVGCPQVLVWLGDLAMKAAVDHNPHFMERKIFSLSVSLNDGGEITEVVYNGGQSTGDKEGGLGGDYS